MGKWQKKKKDEGISLKPTKRTLLNDIESDTIVKSKNRQKVKIVKEEDEYVDSSLSTKILAEARKQQLEIENEECGATAPGTSKYKRAPVLHVNSDQSDEEEAEDDINIDNYYDYEELNEEDQKAFENFMKPSNNLGDMINAVLQNKSEIVSEVASNASCNEIELDPSVRAMYEGVRDILSKYRSGKLPKAFKIVPKLKNWEQILLLLNPQNWSSAAMYQATRIFASNLSEQMAQRFYSLVLLPRIRDDLAEYKRLNYHIRQALIKAIYKPRAFMKGILLPLLMSGSCTLREATIIGAIIAKSSIPVSYSGAAITKIAEMEYTGANSIFLRIFFDKKYALPYQAVDAVVDHFLRFEFDKREMPVLWHQAFLTFVQRYKSDISTEQKERLLELLKKQNHYLITPEIRREIQSAELRDVEMADAMEMK